MSALFRNTLISVAVFASAGIAALALSGAPATAQSVGSDGNDTCRRDNRAAPAEQGYGVIVVGPDGRLIAAAPNLRMWFQLQQGGLPQ